MNKPDPNKVKPRQAVAYSALTVILLVFIVQAGFSMILNIVRNIDYCNKLQIINREYKEAQKKNKNLQYELQSYNTAKSLEAIARNNLKMAAKDEVLIIINQPNKEEDEQSSNENNKFLEFFEKFQNKFNNDMTPDKSPD